MTDLLDALAKPPPAPSELDELMSRNPLEMTKEDIDNIIAYQRQDRARRAEGGTKGKRKSDLKDHGGGAIDLAALGLIKKPTTTTPTPKPKPTSGGGMLRRL